jgi:hypothetical protein
MNSRIRLTYMGFEKRDEARSIPAMQQLHVAIQMPRSDDLEKYIVRMLFSVFHMRTLCSAAPSLSNRKEPQQETHK